jgi:hypothetical protein
MQGTLNVRLGRVRLNIVATENKKLLHILNVGL